MTADAQTASDLEQRTVGGDRTPAATRLGLAERLELMQGSRGRQGELSRVHDLLARAINRDVLPRMVLAHCGEGAAAMSAACVTPRDVAQLAEMAMAHDAPEILSYVERKCAEGMAVDAVYLDLLAPAARLLGELWDDDRVDFGQVTVATDRLRQVMRSFGLAHQDAACAHQATHRALLVPGPGDQHSFGLAMVAEFFGRAGWHVWSGVPESSEQVAQMAKCHWYGIVGFSVGSVVRLDALTQLIRMVRRLSRNRRIGVMVGGPVFHGRPELVTAVGADATASDGRQAVLQAHRLLDLASRHL